MRDKTLQERLRYAGAINDDADCFWVDSDLLREAADLIDRLTAAPSEDAVELVAEALWNETQKDLFSQYKYDILFGELNDKDARTWSFITSPNVLPIVANEYRAFARAAIAALPSEEAIRRNEREKCAQVAEKLGPYWAVVADTIRARNEEK